MINLKTRDEIEREAIEEIRQKWNFERKPEIEDKREIPVQKIEINENNNTLPLKEKIFLKIFSKIFKKKPKISKEEQELEALNQLKFGALEQIKELILKRLTDNLVVELNRIFRIFLRERWGISRSLTYEELVWDEQLHNVPEELKNRILGVILEINEFLYGQEQEKNNKKEEFILTEKIERLIEDS